MGDDHGQDPRGGSITHLIAWLSVCLLAAATGSALDPEWRPLWAQMGAFGLASAVGLSVVAKMRTARRRQALEDAKRSTLERRMEAVVSQFEPSPSLRTTVSRLCQEFLERPPESDQTRAGCLAAYARPVMITPLRRDREGKFLVRGTTTEAQVRDLSVRGVGVAHHGPLPSSLVLLTCDASDGTSLAVVVDLRWSHNLGDGDFLSGGEFVEVTNSDLVSLLELIAVTSQ
ncbi:MAG: hypothetical protein AB7O59_10265 [Pirellulales bacterium]